MQLSRCKAEATEAIYVMLNMNAMTRCYLRRKTPLLADSVVPHTPIALHDPQGRIADLVEQYADQLRGLI